MPVIKTEHWFTPLLPPVYITPKRFSKIDSEGSVLPICARLNPAQSDASVPLKIYYRGEKNKKHDH